MSRRALWTGPVPSAVRPKWRWLPSLGLVTARGFSLFGRRRAGLLPSLPLALVITPALAAYALMGYVAAIGPHASVQFKPLHRGQRAALNLLTFALGTLVIYAGASALAQVIMRTSLNIALTVLAVCGLGLAKLLADALAITWRTSSGNRQAMAVSSRIHSAYHVPVWIVGSLAGHPGRRTAAFRLLHAAMKHRAAIPGPLVAYAATDKLRKDYARYGFLPDVDMPGVLVSASSPPLVRSLACDADGPADRVPGAFPPRG